MLSQFNFLVRRIKLRTETEEVNAESTLLNATVQRFRICKTQRWTELNQKRIWLYRLWKNTAQRWYLSCSLNQTQKKVKYMNHHSSTLIKSGTLTQTALKQWEFGFKRKNWVVYAIMFWACGLKHFRTRTHFGFPFSFCDNRLRFTSLCLYLSAPIDWVYVTFG